MSQVINIGWLLPMWAPRERTNDEWGFWTDMLEHEARKTADPRGYIMVKQLHFMLVYNSCSQVEKKYVVQKLAVLCTVFEIEELNKTDDLDGYINGIQELINDVTPVKGYTEKELTEDKKSFLRKRINLMDKLDVGKREYVEGKLREMYNKFGC